MSRAKLIAVVFIGACGCRGRADASLISKILVNVNEDLAPDAGERHGTWHYFDEVTPRGPVRAVDSKNYRLMDPASILVELGGGDRAVVCAGSEHGYHVYRLAPFQVSWDAICPYDFNYVAEPPNATAPKK